MIVRVFQVTTHPGKDDDFAEFFHETAIPLMQRTQGLRSVTFGEPRPETPTEFCMVMIWEILEALKAFVGDDYANPHILPEEAVLVKERSIKHYDLVKA